MNTHEQGFLGARAFISRCWPGVGLRGPMLAVSHALTGAGCFHSGRSVDTPTAARKRSVFPPPDYGLLLSVSFTALLVGVKWCLHCGVWFCVFSGLATQNVGSQLPEQGSRRRRWESQVAAWDPGAPLAAVSWAFS